MADDPQMLRDHQDTWKGFSRFIFWSTVVVVIVLLGMALFLL